MNDKFSLLKRMRRLSGILVHPTSLPGKFGIGDLGPEAYRFVDFLQESGQHLWQTLPLGPTGGHNSPYQCFSSFAGQPLLISPELLKDEGLLTDADLSNVPHFSDEEVDFAAVGEYKEELFKKAFACFKELPEDNPLKSELALFCKSAHWLDDYAMFMAIKKSKGGAHWLEWEKKYRKPTKSQKAVIEREFEDEILYEKFLQWTFCHQWSQLKAYANERDILLIGDIPIFVSCLIVLMYGLSKTVPGRFRWIPYCCSRSTTRLFQRNRSVMGQPIFMTGNTTKRLITNGGWNVSKHSSY